MQLRAHHLRGVYSFTDAEHIWSSRKAWRGGDPNVKPLGTRRQKQCKLVRIDDDTYACRYYNTDVSTYHRDGRVVIESYDTVSTRMFAHHTTPSHVELVNIPGVGEAISVRTSLEKPKHNYYWGRGHIYPLDDNSRITIRAIGDALYTIDNGGATFTVPRLVRAGTQSMLQASGFHDLYHWWKAYRTLKGQDDLMEYGRGYRPTAYSALMWDVMCSHDPAKWQETADKYRCSASTWEKLRVRVYREAGAYVEDKVESFKDYTEAHAIGRRIRLYQGY